MPRRYRNQRTDTHIHIQKKMRNDGVLPSLPSQLYIFAGNSQVQMPTSDVVSMQLDNNSVFSVDSKPFYEFGDGGGGGFTIPSQSILSHHQESSSSSMTVQRLDYPCSGAEYQTSLMPSYHNTNISQLQHPMLHNKKFIVPQFEAGYESMPNSRKRPIEVNDLIENSAALNECKKNKKKKKATMCFEKQWHNHQVKEEEPLHINNFTLPVRRSQKVNDKITALQKLVSPYGKTDTASVLQEASIYIKLLQERIRNMFEMMSSSHVNIKSLIPQESIEEKKLDLKSRGMCLVPVSITRKLTRDDRHTISRKTMIPKNF